VDNGLSGAQKAATLVMLLDENPAARLLKDMSDSTVVKLRKATEGLRVAEIGHEQKQDILKSFLVKQDGGRFLLGDAHDRFRRLLVKARGEQEAVRFYESEGGRERAPVADTRPETGQEQDDEVPVASTALDYVNTLPPKALASLLEEEAPRCAAVLLSSLSVDKTAEVLNMMEEERREAIVERALTNGPVSREVAEAVASAIRDRMERYAKKGESVDEGERMEGLARILGGLDREARQRVLSNIQERDSDFAAEIRKQVFQFKDLLRVDKRSMTELLRRVDVADIALAVKGLSEEFSAELLSCMSQRMQEQVQEERELTGRVPVARAEEARERIMELGREMYFSGELEIESGEGQYVE